MKYVGIDLGTTNSAIASYDGDKVSLYKSPEQHDVTPSAIFIDRRGNKFVGERAYMQAARNPDNSATLFKRMMGTSTPIHLKAIDRTMTPEECSAEVLRTVFAYLPEDLRTQEETGTVITVPAAFNQMQKDATLSAAEQAGIGKVALMQEPVAAVMSVMQTRDHDGIFLIFDLGGGTLDIAIAQSMKGRVSLLAHGGVEMCGGRDIDRAIMDELVRPWLVNAFDLDDGFITDPKYKSLIRMATWAAERAKIELSLGESATISQSESEISARDNSGEEIYLDIPISRVDLNALIVPVLDKAIKASRETLEQAGISPHDVGQIVFVGGPTQYKPLQDKIAFELGIAGSTNVNPMTAVAEGAAIFAESIDWSTQSRGRKATRSGISSSGFEFAYVSRTPNSAARLVAKKVGISRGEFQVDSLDTGWTSGRKDLSEGATIELPLSRPGENAFRVFVFDASGMPVKIPNDRILISRTAASVDAIPASHTLSVEALERINGPKVLVPLVRAGDQLPKKGVLSMRAGEMLRAGSPSTLNFKIWEGEIRDPIEDNAFVGVFRIAGTHFEHGTISAGDEIHFEYEVTDAGTIRLDVSVPSVSGSFTDDVSYYVRQGAAIDYSQAGSFVISEAEAAIARLDVISECVNDARITDVRHKIRKAASLNVDRADPEETKQALDTIKEARREISLIRKDNLKPIRQSDLDKMRESFDKWTRSKASADELEMFDALMRTAQRSIDTNGTDFETVLEEIHSLNFSIHWRSDDFAIERFHWLSSVDHLFTDKNAHQQLIREGQHALSINDIKRLREVLIQMDTIRFVRSGEEEMLAMANVVRG